MACLINYPAFQYNADDDLITNSQRLWFCGSQKYFHQEISAGKINMITLIPASLSCNYKFWGLTPQLWTEFPQVTQHGYLRRKSMTGLSCTLFT